MSPFRYRIAFASVLVGLAAIFTGLALTTLNLIEAARFGRIFATTKSGSFDHWVYLDRNPISFWYVVFASFTVYVPFAWLGYLVAGKRPRRRDFVQTFQAIWHLARYGDDRQ
jgi:hypothetical protein